MSRIKGIIFDMDNTLLRSTIDFPAMKQETFAFLVSRGLLPPETDLTNHTTSTLIGAAAKNNAMTDALIQEMWEIPTKHEKKGMRDADLEPGVIDLLERLKEKVCLCIVTNNSVEAAEAALAENGIRQYFDCVVGRESMKALKPSPDGFDAIRSAYTHISQEEWLSVGDSWIDGKASADAGIKFVAYNGDAQKMQAMGITPVASIKDIQEIIVISEELEVMEQIDLSRVSRTQKRLRLQTISSVLDEFDNGLMGLDEKKKLQKYRKMLQNPFLFYRGSAYLFYSDVSREWSPYHSPPDKPTWIQGDLHFENFGAFRSESGRIVFDVNDFDEGCTGSYLYDLLRMTVSLVLVCRMRNLALNEQKSVLKEYLQAYVKQMWKFAKRKESPHALVFDAKETAGPIRKLLKKVEKRSSSDLLEGLTAMMDRGRQFVWSEEILRPSEEERKLLESAWLHYVRNLNATTKRPESYYRIKDVAVKHGSGTASIGLDRYYILIEGEGGDQALDDVIIEAKEVRAPIPAYFTSYDEHFWEQYAHQGKRVIATQQAMHHEADPYLGYMTLDGRHFYVRERSPFKKKLKPDKIDGLDDWLKVMKTMGQITAKLHARADADVNNGLLPYHSEDEIVRAIGEDTDAFLDYMIHWALAYSHQVEEDFELFAELLEQRWGITLEAEPRTTF